MGETTEKTSDLWLDVQAAILEIDGTNASIKVRVKGESIPGLDPAPQWWVLPAKGGAAKDSAAREYVTKTFKEIQEALDKNRLVQVKFKVPLEAEGFRVVSPITPSR